VVDFETHDFWRGVAHRDDARAVRAGRERDRDRGNLDARAGARPNLEHRNVEIVAFDREADDREVKQWIAIPRNYKRVELVAGVTGLSFVQDVKCRDQITIRDDAEGAAPSQALTFRCRALAFFTVSGRAMSTRRI